MLESTELFLKLLSAPKDNKNWTKDKYDEMKFNNPSLKKLEDNKLFNLLVNHMEFIQASDRPQLIDKEKLNILFNENPAELQEEYKDRPIQLDPYAILKEKFSKDKAYSLISQEAGTTIYIYPKQKTVRFVGRRAFLRFILEDYGSSTILAFVISKLFPFIEITEPAINECIMNEKQIRDQQLRLMKDFIKQATESEDFKIEVLGKEIQEHTSEIKRILQKIQDVKNKIKELEFNKVFSKEEGESKTLDNLVNVVKRYPTIKDIKAEHTPSGMALTVETRNIKVTKYDRTFVEAKKDRIYDRFPHFKEPFLKAHRGEADIFFSGYEITISSQNGELDVRFFPKNNDYRNPHEGANCLGSYSEHLQKLKENRDLIGIIRYMLEYLQSVNFHDIGYSSLPNNCIIKDKKGELIYDGKNNRNQTNS